MWLRLKSWGKEKKIFKYHKTFIASLLTQKTQKRGNLPRTGFHRLFSCSGLKVFFLCRLLQLQEQMRALYKAISVPRVRRASSKGGGGYTCQSGSGWDEFTKHVTSECLGWMRQQRVSSFLNSPNLCRPDVPARWGQPMCLCDKESSRPQVAAAACCLQDFPPIQFEKWSSILEWMRFQCGWRISLNAL